MKHYKNITQYDRYKSNAEAEKEKLDFWYWLGAISISIILLGQIVVMPLIDKYN